jgi:hypothetical protein
MFLFVRKYVRDIGRTRYTVNLFYHALALFQQANYIDWINVCYILSVTEI